ncbi:MAG: LysE family transporter [Spirochaetaceae bacterium]|nr:LysE family transporter [Myxococcales bacterium]MCB9724766.1 LysE family transporter [Spirochaetaceae bacterium]
MVDRILIGSMVLLLVAGVGFATSAPVGPVNLICARRTLEAGWRAGFAVATGAIAAETVYATLVVSGLSLSPRFVEQWGTTLRRLAGSVLVVVAVVAWRRARRVPRDVLTGPSPTGPVSRPLVGTGAAFLLALSNPLPIASMGLGLSAIRDLVEVPLPWALELVGLIVGVSLWWLVLTITLSRARRRMAETTIARLNRGVAVLLGVMGVGMLAGLPRL